jgi:hypothetical protein
VRGCCPESRIAIPRRRASGSESVLRLRGFGRYALFLPFNLIVSTYNVHVCLTHSAVCSTPGSSSYLPPLFSTRINWHSINRVSALHFQCHWTMIGGMNCSRFLERVPIPGEFCLIKSTKI